MDKPERLRVLNTLAERISNGTTADALSLHGAAFDFAQLLQSVDFPLNG